MRIIELIGGVYGFRATMFPYIPSDKQQLLLRAIRQSDSQYLRHLLTSARDVEQELRRYSPRLETWQEQENKKWQKQLQNTIRDLDSGIDDPHILAKMPREIHYSEIPVVTQFALRLGMSSHEAESLIEWQMLPMTSMELERLSQLIRVLICVPKSTARERELATRAYTTYLIHEAMIMHYGIDYNSLPDNVIMDNLQLVAERVARQVCEMGGFMTYCFASFPATLHAQPIKIPTEHYTETMRVERTQQDLVNEMAQELINLPRFMAYVKHIRREESQQVTLKRRIQTQPLPDPHVILKSDYRELPSRPGDTVYVIFYDESFCRPRSDIEQEIRERQTRWQRPPEPPLSPQPPPKPRGPKVVSLPLPPRRPPPRHG